MNQPPEHHEALPAPGQDSVHSHFEGRDHTGEQHGDSEGIPKDLKPASTGTMIIAGVIALVAFVGLFILGIVPHIYRQHAAAKQAEEVNDSKPVVQVAKPKVKDEAANLELPADARAFQETAIYPRATGYLNKLMVDIGDTVKAGQLLATIDQPDTEADLAQAKATLGQTQANLDKAQSDFELAQTTLKRYEGFAATGGVTQQSLDEKRSAYIEAQSALEGGKANVKAGDATVQRLQTLLNFGQVVAPFSGVIGMRNYDVGAYISPSNTGEGRELFRISDVSTLRVFVNVPQTYVTSIKLGQKALLAVKNYPGQDFAGTVTRTAGTLDASTRTLRYEIDFPNSDGKLYAGMYATLKMPIIPARPPMTVPTSALVFDAGGTKLWTLVDSDKVKSVPVSIGRDYGQELEILTGLSQDEQVVSNPGLRLADGTTVTVSKPNEQVAQR